MIADLFGELLPENINGVPCPKELTTTPNSYKSITVTQRSSLLHPLCGRDASEKGSALLPKDPPSSPPPNPLPSSPQAPKAINEGYKEETN